MGAAGDEVGELVLANQVASAQLDAVHLEKARHFVDAGFQGVVGGRLAKATHRLLGRLVGHHRHGVVLDALNAVRPHDGADGLAQLQGRAARVGANVVQGAHAHGAQGAVVLKAQRHIKNAIRALHVAAAHVLDAVFHKAHGATEFFGQVAHHDGVLQATLDAVAAAHVYVKVHAHTVAGQAQGFGQLVGELGHLDRGPHVEHFGGVVPLAGHGKGFDGHRRVTRPAHAVAQLVVALCKVFFDRTPNKLAVKNQVRAVRRVHQRCVAVQGCFGVHDVGGLFVLDHHQLGGVFGQSAGVGHHSGHPFTGVARNVRGHGKARDLRCIHAGQHRVGGGAQLSTGDHRMHAGHGQGLAGVDAQNLGAGIGAGHQGHVQHALAVDVGGVMALAHHKAFVLYRAAVFADVAKRGGVTHGCAPGGRWRASPHPQFAGSQCSGTGCR